jgi:hypothetical protein
MQYVAVGNKPPGKDRTYALNGLDVSCLRKGKNKSNVIERSKFKSMALNRPLSV